MTNENENEQGMDIFIMDTVYPEAHQIFRTDSKSIEDLKDDAVFVIDTHALLVPYSIGRDSLEQIRIAYQRVVEREQLIIPGQVAREFARNRAVKISELYQQLNRKRNSIANLQKGRYPLLESVALYQEAVDLESRIDGLLREYRKSIGDVLSHIQSWNWNDPVTEVYSELFTDAVVCEPEVDHEEVEQELARRQRHKIPPGYKDASKDDQGIGDLLIWLTILEIAGENHVDVIFVSGEQKPDWWIKSEKQALYPRFELIDEFRRTSEGKSFRIISFSDFLDLYGATTDAVDEVREEEQRSVEKITAYGAFITTWVDFEHTLKEAVERYLPGKGQRRLRGAGLMLRELAAKDVIPGNLVERALELNAIRNRVVHGHSTKDLSAMELASITENLIEIIAELRALQL
jgi:uncharacterized protein YutE (UPF0331/DUF86 family)/exonuclease VII small subunit